MNEGAFNFTAAASMIAVWVVDHWSAIAAFVLFILQATYQIYRIKKAKQECRED